MNTLKIIFFTLVTCTLAGCANLKEVRDYATESARFSAYSELTTRFRDTYEREQPYLDGDAERRAQINDKKRKAAYDDLLRIHQRVALYMQTLATLAGEDAFDITREADYLVGEINAYPEFGIEKKHADAASNISKVITRWASSAYQQNAVRNMVKNGDAPLQITLKGMLALVRYYRKTHENEKKTVMGFFEMEAPFILAKDKLMISLVRAQERSREVEYRNAQLLYDDAEKGLINIAEGHKRLYENIDSLSNVRTQAEISRLASDIRIIRNSLQKNTLKLRQQTP